jgi:hypothetical protein
MHETEGSIYIIKLDGSAGPEYDVSFSANIEPGRALRVRRVKGDDGLRRLLREDVSVLPQFVDQALKQARTGRATIPHVRLSDDRGRALGW